MLRGYWGIFAAIAGLAFVLTTATALTLALYPEQPDLTGNAGYQEELPGYRAGGADCQPNVIARLPSRERARHTKACDDAEEQHRLDTNDLIQQRRSADAADAMTILSYEQTGIAAWGLALGFITMAAAIAAAFYARSAAIHSEKSHKSFVEAERAVLRVTDAGHGELSGGGHDRKRDIIAVSFRNIGRTAARVTLFGSKTSGGTERWVDIPAGEVAVVPGPEIPDSRGVILDGWFWIEYTIVGGGTGTANFKIQARPC